MFYRKGSILFPSESVTASSSGRWASRTTLAWQRQIDRVACFQRFHDDDLCPAAHCCLVLAFVYCFNLLLTFDSLSSKMWWSEGRTNGRHRRRKRCGHFDWETNSIIFTSSFCFHSFLTSLIFEISYFPFAGNLYNKLLVWRITYVFGG